MDEASLNRKANNLITELDKNRDGKITLEEAKPAMDKYKPTNGQLIPALVSSDIKAAHCEPKQLFDLVPLPISVFGPEKCAPSK